MQEETTPAPDCMSPYSSLIIYLSTVDTRLVFGSFGICIETMEYMERSTGKSVTSQTTTS